MKIITRTVAAATLTAILGAGSVGASAPPDTDIADAAASCADLVDEVSALWPSTMEVADDGHSLVLVTVPAAMDVWKCLASGLDLPDWLSHLIPRGGLDEPLTTVELSSGYTVRWMQDARNGELAIVVHDVDAG